MVKCIVKKGMFFNNIKSPIFQMLHDFKEQDICLLTYSFWSGMTLTRDLITQLDLVTAFDIFGNVKSLPYNICNRHVMTKVRKAGSIPFWNSILKFVNLRFLTSNIARYLYFTLNIKSHHTALQFYKSLHHNYLSLLRSNDV